MHELEEILWHYTDDFEMTSPIISVRMAREDGSLKGKSEVGEYWSVGLASPPKLHF